MSAFHREYAVGQDEESCTDTIKEKKENLGGCSKAVLRGPFWKRSKDHSFWSPCGMSSTNLLLKSRLLECLPSVTKITGIPQPEDILNHISYSTWRSLSVGSGMIFLRVLSCCLACSLKEQKDSRHGRLQRKSSCSRQLYPGVQDSTNGCPTKQKFGHIHIWQDLQGIFLLLMSPYGQVALWFRHLFLDRYRFHWRQRSAFNVFTCFSETFLTGTFLLQEGSELTWPLEILGKNKGHNVTINVQRIKYPSSAWWKICI